MTEALSCAAGKGYGKVVKVLLEREEVNLDGPDQSGQTPLSYAPGKNIEK